MGSARGERLALVLLLMGLVSAAWSPILTAVLYNVYLCMPSGRAPLCSLKMNSAFSLSSRAFNSANYVFNGRLLLSQLVAMGYIITYVYSDASIFSRGDACAFSLSKTPKCQLSSNAVNTHTALGNECFYFHSDTRALLYICANTVLAVGASDFSLSAMTFDMFL